MSAWRKVARPAFSNVTSSWVNFAPIASLIRMIVAAPVMPGTLLFTCPSGAMSAWRAAMRVRVWPKGGFIRITKANKAPNSNLHAPMKLQFSTSNWSLLLGDSFPLRSSRPQKHTLLRQVRQPTSGVNSTAAHIGVRYTRPAPAADVGADPVARPQIVRHNLVLGAELDQRKIRVASLGQLAPI